jgi:hypothetical protein
MLKLKSYSHRIVPDAFSSRWMVGQRQKERGDDFALLCVDLRVVAESCSRRRTRRP